MAPDGGTYGCRCTSTCCRCGCSQVAAVAIGTEVIASSLHDFLTSDYTACLFTAHDLFLAELRAEGGRLAQERALLRPPERRRRPAPARARRTRRGQSFVAELRQAVAA